MIGLPSLVRASNAAATVVDSVLPPDFNDTLVTSVSSPTELAWTPDGRMLIASKNGQLRVYANATLLPTPALNLSSISCTDNERGLEGVAVHPSFSSNRYIYLYYTFQKFGTCTDSETDGPVNRLSRFTLPNTNVISTASELVLLDTPPLPTNMHNGGDLAMGKDGNLYVTVGEGGTACCSSNPGWAEDPGVVFGKILRLTDNGGIPPDNPFTGPGTARCNIDGVPPPSFPSGTKCQEVYAMGLRNPFRFAFDPNYPGVRFFINDVGEDTWEEVDQGQAGADYGWPIREGPCVQGSIDNCGPPPPGITKPIYWYGHNVTVNGNGCGAITGAAFVPNGIWPGSLNGAYLFADFICGQIGALTPNSQQSYSEVDFATVETIGLTSMRFGPYGLTQALYYTTFASGGQIRRIAYTGAANLAALIRDFREDWSDYNNDGRVDLTDILVAVQVYGAHDSYWDYTKNGRVDIPDLANAALYYGMTFSGSPYPGQGQPPGFLDPGWRPRCYLLPPIDQDYCNSLP